MDVMAALKERKEKALSKVSRAEKALDSAQKELADVLAAERIMSELTGESPEPKSSDSAASERDRQITKLLPTSEADSISPANLHSIYTTTYADPISLEAFRTAVWRLLKKTINGEEKVWTVHSNNGRYWREAVPDGPDDFDLPNDEDKDPWA